MYYLLAVLFLVTTESQSTRKVSILFEGGEFKYDAYQLEWGDGTKAFHVSDEMPSEWVRTHIYEKDGTYIITLLLRKGDQVFKAFSKRVIIKVVNPESKEAP